MSASNARYNGSLLCAPGESVQMSPCKAIFPILIASSFRLEPAAGRPGGAITADSGGSKGRISDRLNTGDTVMFGDCVTELAGNGDGWRFSLFPPSPALMPYTTLFRARNRTCVLRPCQV